ncbi:MAG: WD40/YVTN/BNR-like repeat-containing protein [Pyrinomonadaceae bacterium]
MSIFFLAATGHAQWLKQTVNSTASFRGLSVVNEKIIWASGTDGTIIRTIDGGKTWKMMTVPGAEKLDFRDIEAFDTNTAYILSIGNGDSSRIYKTTNGGKRWTLEFKNEKEKAFYDALDCFNKIHCTALSDPVDGKFVITKTGPAIPGTMPPALDGEAAFAASGTCLVKQGDTLFFVTGGNGSRVFRSVDRGYNWEVFDTPFIKGTAGSGIFSIAMFDQKLGVIVGGNYENPNDAKDNLAFTTDGGETWKLSAGLTGYRSAVTYFDKNTIIAVGTNGSDISRDGGKTWKVFGKEDLNAVQSKGKRATWAVGPKGMVVKMK